MIRRGRTSQDCRWLCTRWCPHNIHDDDDDDEDGDDDDGHGEDRDDDGDGDDKDSDDNVEDDDSDEGQLTYFPNYFEGPSISDASNLKDTSVLYWEPKFLKEQTSRSRDEADDGGGDDGGDDGDGDDGGGGDKEDDTCLLNWVYFQIWAGGWNISVNNRGLYSRSRDAELMATTLAQEVAAKEEED